jgi:hypothetical protein
MPYMMTGHTKGDNLKGLIIIFVVIMLGVSLFAVLTLASFNRRQNPILDSPAYHVPGVTLLFTCSTLTTNPRRNTKVLAVCNFLTLRTLERSWFLHGIILYQNSDMSTC